MQVPPCALLAKSFASVGVRGTRAPRTDEVTVPHLLNLLSAACTKRKTKPPCSLATSPIMSSCVEHNKTRHRPPRPILKSLPEYSPLPFSSYPLHSPHVHFPPTPSLTSTSFTHPSTVYDRAPIVVSENVCALPERGGRCYTPQPRNKRSSRRSRTHSYTDSVDGPSNAQAPEPKGSYFHPRAFEACEPERSVSTHDHYHSYYALPDLTSSSDSSSSSSSSSSSDSDSDSSCGSFTSSSPSIPRVVVNSTLGDAPSTYPPPDSSLILQNGTQSRLSHSSQRQQQQHLVHYACPSSTAESKPKKTASGSGRRVKSAVGRSSSNSSLNTAARLARFGGGFSDQAMLLEGCLGGF